MKYFIFAFIVFAFINGILAQYDSPEEDDDFRGYGYTSTAMILKRIEQELNSLDYFRNNKLNGAQARAKTFFTEVDYKKIFSEKIHELEVQFQEELQKNSNQVCNEVFEKKKVELNEDVQGFPSLVDNTIEMLTGAADLMEKTLKRMTERVYRYSAEAGDCRVVDNAQCELLARYYKDLNDVYSENMIELRNELGKYDKTFTAAELAEEITEAVTEKIANPLKSCLSRSA